MTTGPRSHGVVPVRSTPAGWRVLLLRAWRNWDFPKGAADPGEAPLETAIREAAEEAALTDLRFDWGHDSLETAPYGRRHKVATYFVARTQKAEVELPVNPELGHPEHHEGRWVSFDEAEALLPERLRPVLTWARRRVQRSSGLGIRQDS